MAEHDKKPSDMIRIGGLWKNTSRAGVEYLSGSLGSARLMIFRNDRKRPGEKDPDYSIFLAAPTEKGPGGPASAIATAGDSRDQEFERDSPPISVADSPAPDPVSFVATLDDIPF